MSFFLQKSIRRSNGQGSDLSRSLLKGLNGKADDDNSKRILPAGRSSALGRGARVGARQQTSGNQVMLQDQRPPVKLLKQTKQQVRKETSKQEQTFGDYTMDEIMQDLVILQEQQREAQMKLKSAQTTKKKRLEKQQQLNTLLEKKNFTNGTRRAKLVQLREFLSVATRDLGNRKLVTDRLQEGISSFERKVKKGVRSTKMIQICNANIDASLILAEHKEAKVARLKFRANLNRKSTRGKYDRMMEAEREIQRAIHGARKRIRRCNRRTKNLGHIINSRKHYKLMAHNRHQSVELRIRSLCDQMKVEVNRVAVTKAELSVQIQKVAKQREVTVFRILKGRSFRRKLNSHIQVQKGKIVDFFKSQGYIPSVQINGVYPMCSQATLRDGIARFEIETTKGNDDLEAIEKSIVEMKRAIVQSRENMARTHVDTSSLASSVKSMASEEQERKQTIADLKMTLESARAEVGKLERSFLEMKDNRDNEKSVYSNTLAEIDIEIKKHTQMVESLNSNVKMEEIALKTKARLFEENEQPQLAARLEEAIKGSGRAETAYNDQREMSSEGAIESKLESKFKNKIGNEILDLDIKNQRLVARCEERIEKFPALEKIDCTYDDKADKSRQVKTALLQLRDDCNARIAAAESAKEQKSLQKRDYQAEIEAMKRRIKSKEDTQTKTRRHQLREESRRRDVSHHTGFDALRSHRGSIEEPVSSCAGNVPTRLRQRRKKGAEFFDPKEDDDGKKDDDVTPARPRDLVSSFLSQSSGNRVRWKDVDDSTTKGRSEVPDDSNATTCERNRKTNSSDTKRIFDPNTETPKTSNTKERNGTVDKNTDHLDHDATNQKDINEFRKIKQNPVSILDANDNSACTISSRSRKRRNRPAYKEERKTHLRVEKRKKPEDNVECTDSARGTSSSDDFAFVESRERNRKSSTSISGYFTSGDTVKYDRRYSASIDLSTSSDNQVVLKKTKAGAIMSKDRREESGKKSCNTGSAEKDLSIKLPESSCQSSPQGTTIEFAVSDSKNVVRDRSISATTCSGEKKDRKKVIHGATGGNKDDQVAQRQCEVDIDGASNGAPGTGGDKVNATKGRSKSVVKSTTGKGHCGRQNTPTVDYMRDSSCTKKKDGKLKPIDGSHKGREKFRINKPTKSRGRRPSKEDLESDDKKTGNRVRTSSSALRTKGKLHKPVREKQTSSTQNTSNGTRENHIKKSSCNGTNGNEKSTSSKVSCGSSGASNSSAKHAMRSNQEKRSGKLASVSRDANKGMSSSSQRDGDSGGKLRQKSSCSIGESRSVRSENNKSHGRNRESSSIREGSVGGSKRDSKGKILTKSNSSVLSEKARDKERKTSSGSSQGISSVSTQSRKPLKARVSSSTRDAGSRKRQKVKEDAVSVSTAGDTVYTRRRKKRTVQRPMTTSSFGDASCDVEFQ